MKNNIIVLTLLFIVFYACEKPKEFPDEPQIDFTKVYITDTTDALDNPVKMHAIYFTVIDGDDNFGLEKGDTIGVFDTDSIFNSNLFITTFYKQDGKFTELYTDYPLKFRIPKTYVVGLNKYFKAEVKIEISFPLLIYNSDARMDTIYYSFYTVDKSFNYSNVEQTWEIKKTDYGFITDTTVFLPQELK